MKVWLNPAWEGSIYRWWGPRPAFAPDDELDKSDGFFNAATSLQVAMREWRKSRAGMPEDGTKATDPPAGASGGEGPPQESTVVEMKVASLSRDIGTFRNQRQLWIREAKLGKQKRTYYAGSGPTVLTEFSLRRFYSAPAVRFLTRFIASVGFLSIIIVLTFQFHNLRPSRKRGDSLNRLSPLLPVEYPTPSVLECVWFFFQVGDLLDHIAEQVRANRIGNGSMAYEGRIWSSVRVFAILSCAAAIALRTAAYIVQTTPQTDEAEALDAIWRANFLLDGVQLSISLNGLAIALTFLPTLSQFSRQLGSLVIVMEEMGSDIALWTIVQLVVLVGFILLFYGLGEVNEYISPPDQITGKPNLYAQGGALSLPFMALFGELPIDSTNASWWAAFCLWVYAIISSLILVNLLIAMFSDTYSEFSAKSESEYAFRRCVLLYMQRHIELPIPPPLNLPLALWRILMENDVCRKVGCTSTANIGTAFVRLTPSIARNLMAEPFASDVHSEVLAERRDADPRDGAVLVEAFLRQCAEEEARTVEMKHERQQAEVLRRLDGLAIRMGRMESEHEALRAEQAEAMAAQKLPGLRVQNAGPSSGSTPRQAE